MSSAAQKKSGYKLPDIIRGHPLMCVTLKIPDEPFYQAAFYGALMSLGQWYSWEKTYEPGDERATDAANYWRHLLHDHLVFGECPGEGELGTCLPIGTVLAWTGAYDAIPEGWMICAGQFLDIVDFPDIYAAVDDAWREIVEPFPGVFDYGTRLPDLRGRSIIGANYDPFHTFDQEIRLMGETGGEDEHQLTGNELPALTPRVTAWQQAADTTLPGTARGLSTAAENIYRINPNTNPTTLESRAPFGGNQPHNNMHPFQAMNYIIRILPCPEEENLGGFRLRQHPDSECVVQQSFDNGLNWSTAFIFPDCPKEDDSPGTIINNYINYINYMDEVKDDYDGNPESIAPGMDDPGATRDAAICYAIRILTYAAMTAAAEERERSENFNIIFGALVGGAGLIFGLLTAGTGLLLTGAIAAGFAGGIYALIKDTSEEDLRNTAATEKVICCAVNALAGATPTQNLFQTAWDGCGFTAGTAEYKQAQIMAELAQPLETYLAFLKAAQEGVGFAESGLIEPCDNCATPCSFEDFRPALVDWVMVNGQKTTAGVKSIWQTAVPARVSHTPGGEVTFTKLRVRAFVPRNDDAQFVQIRVINDGVPTEVRRWDYQTVGWHIFEWNGAVDGETIDITATGTAVLTNDCILEWAEACYI